MSEIQRGKECPIEDFRALRKKYQLTQVQAALVFGICLPSIKRLDRGPGEPGMPRISTLSAELVMKLFEQRDLAQVEKITERLKGGDTVLEALINVGMPAPEKRAASPKITLHFESYEEMDRFCRTHRQGR